ERGAMLIAAGIAISTLGFLSQSILTAPRVYFAMAKDGVFFKSVAWIHPRTRVPVVAIALQGVWATVIAATGKYEQILNYVVSTDFIFFGLTATCLFVFRKREAAAAAQGEDGIASTRRVPRMPGHPYSTLLFIAACWLVVMGTIYKYPGNSAVGLAIVLAGIPVYFLWGRRAS
ncbi:MAG: amino acid permease, partial [Bryobacteraceae bacterium]